jgi:putative heme-binding domain-containing protein
MRHTLLPCALLAALAIQFVGTDIEVYAQSPKWTENRLPVREGLQLWLDAGTLNDARKANQLPALDDGKLVDRWPDGSGNQRDFSQTESKSQPKLVRVGERGVPLVKVENPPSIQMLVPGFQVTELPVDLTNVNNVRFREDGRLVTLGYNGDIHLLSDSNGDGIEDHAHLFWKNEGSLRGPIGLQLTPPGYAKGRGMFVPSKGKVSLIVDTNGDDKADEEIVVASGWKEIPQNVDAVGIVMDKDGSLYFGLGTANYANAYQVDDQGKAAYDLKSDRGTVQRVSPDFKRREIVCTGIRFPIAFAFNRNGDLFCSEQEGATWLPNGNPLDELLHVQTGRHYGFPPRHPQYNPDVIDEPSTFDYGPQHQSTCGMVFNQAVNGGPTFGPSRWAEDVIMCGESRGKIWRTKLVKTDVGYVAASQLLACLQMLTVDACVAPNGDLLVACHSGPPDWGTGPTGKGKLFRIKMAQQSAPQPVAVWPETANEIRISFDRPLDPLKMRRLVDQVHVEYGDYVRAGDRFEGLVPPYAVVRRQSVAPRFILPVAGVSLTNDLRTMIVNTAKMETRGYYAVTVPRGDDGTGERAELAQTELDFAIHGAQISWESAESKSGGDVPVMASWIPHLDLKVARELTQGSAQHESLWVALSKPGTLKIRTQINLRDILRPAIQLGGSIDYQWPKEEATLTLKSTQSMSVESKNGGMAQANSQSGKEIRLKSTSNESELVSLEIELTTGQESGIPVLTVSTSTNEDPRQRPVQLHRFFMPWIPSKQTDLTEQAPAMKIAELEGGNWGRGRRVFHSEEAGCFKCHAVGSVGANIGPNLTNLVHRDYASVMRDIVNPSFAINPDYIGHVVALETGEVLTGVLRDEGGQLLLGDAQGKSIQLDRSKIDHMKPAQVSVMPTGLHEKISKVQLRDLMTYLLTPAPTMPLDAPLKAPPIRTEAEVAAALAGSAPLPEKLRQLKIVLVAGKKDHGPGEHDYPAWQKQWEQLLTAGRNIDVTSAWDFPSDEQIAKADLLLFFQKGAWNDERAKKLDAFLVRGGGAVYIHWAVNGDDRVADFSTRIGLASKGGSIRYRHGPLSLELHNQDNPILRNFSALDLYDESYWLLTGDVGKVTLLASSKEDDAPQPQMWTYEKGDGRVFVSIPGHYNWTFDDPLFRILLFRGMAWCAKEPIDRFNELVPLGARMRQ